MCGLLTVLASVLVLSLPLMIGAEPYVAGHLGGSFPFDTDIRQRDGSRGENAIALDADLDSSLIFGGKAGYALPQLPVLGVELEAYHFSHDLPRQTLKVTGTSSGDPVTGAEIIKKFDVDATAGGLNFLLRVPLPTEIKLAPGEVQPYLRVGLGIFTIDVGGKGGRPSDGESRLGLHVLGGLRAFLSDHLAFFVEVIKFTMPGVEFEFGTTTDKADLTSHHVYGGLVWHFK